MKIKRLNDAEVEAARDDTRFRPRQRLELREMVHPRELEFAGICEALGIAYEYEDLFFPTQFPGGVEHGITPDFSFPNLPDVFVEVTDRRACQDKYRKIVNAERIYGIRVILLQPQRMELIKTHPELLWPMLCDEATISIAGYALPKSA